MQRIRRQSSLKQVFYIRVLVGIPEIMLGRAPPEEEVGKLGGNVGKVDLGVRQEHP